MSDFQFDEAIAFYRNKIKLPTAGWTDLWQEQHSHAFVVAGANHDAIVEDFFNAVQKAKWAKDGGGYEGFRANFDEIAAKHGWAHNGSPGWRSRIIYDTNITQAYNAGRYQQMQDVKEFRPYWRYRHTSSEHPRLHHLAWDGIILSAEDSWWNTHFPQNGWRCKCRVDSLSQTEAEQLWRAKGKTGVDTAPPIEWEKRWVGKNSANPRLVNVPKGIDPGFAYNPGKAWLQPHTVPPLTGYDKVLEKRGVTWPSGRADAVSLPHPTNVPASVLVSAEAKPEAAVAQFLNEFGATMEHDVVIMDQAGSYIPIGKSMFQDAAGDFKWLADTNKTDRLKYINLMAMALHEPDEIWWSWVQDRGQTGKWRMKRRYLRAFNIDGTNDYFISVFEWGSDGWSGVTTFRANYGETEADRLAYFEKQRIGRLVYKK